MKYGYQLMEKKRIYINYLFYVSKFICDYLFCLIDNITLYLHVITSKICLIFANTDQKPECYIYVVKMIKTTFTLITIFLVMCDIVYIVLQLSEI